MKHALKSLARWFDAGADDGRDAADGRGVDWLRIAPFLALHASVLLVPLVGWSPVALLVAAVAYAARMFAVTAFFHRYLSHRAFETSRPVRLALALLGASAVQRGPLWWAAHHRRHHRHSDGEGDAHSPARGGFWWSHVGWLLARENFRTRREEVRDLLRWRELALLDRFDSVVPLATAALAYALGAWLERVRPGLGTDGPQMLVWGFGVSTVLLHHCTFAINSLAHRHGTRRFATRDDSRNVWWLALLTFGEGWHNNHHAHPGAARQGLRWWEVDLTWYALRALAALGLVWDLRPPLRPQPAAARRRSRRP